MKGKDNMNKTIKTLLFVIAISLVGINVQLYFNNENIFIKEAKADVAGMGWSSLSYDYDFKKAVRKVVERYCYVYDGEYLSC